MPPNILLFYCSNLWALTTSAQKFLPGLLLRPKVPPRLLLAPQIAKGGAQVSARAIFTPHTVSAPKLHRAYFQRPKLQKGGYLYTPQIKFGRILNNSRFCRLYGVFLRRRHSAFLQIAPISRRATSARCLFFCKWPRLARHQRPVIFLPIAWIGPPTRRPLSKTIQPAFAAFCPVSKLHPFFAPYIFPAQISRLAKSHPFLHFSFVCKKQRFLHVPQF